MDRYWGKVALLMKFDGPDGSTVFTDSAQGNYFTIQYGSPDITTDFSKFGGSSLDLRGPVGSTDYWGIECQNFDLALLNDSVCTIECWIYPTTASQDGNLLNSQSWGYVNQNNWALWCSSTQLAFFVGDSNSGTSQTVMAATMDWSAQVGSWHHVAVTKSGTSVKMYFDGGEIASGTITTTMGRRKDRFFSIGSYHNSPFNGYHFQGLVDSIRITMDIVRYSSPFNSSLMEEFPAFGPLYQVDPLWDQVQFLFTGDGVVGTGSFTEAHGSSLTKVSLPTTQDGRVGQAMRCGSPGHIYSNTIFPLAAVGASSQDFTVEFWFKSEIWVPGDHQMMGFAFHPMMLGAQASGSFMHFFVEVWGSSWNWMSAVSTIATDDTGFHHYALTRAGTTWNLWIDGEKIGTKNVSYDPAQTGPTQIGSNGGAGVPGAGGTPPGRWLVEDVKFTIGTALYGSTFWPARNAAKSRPAKVLAGTLFEEGVPVVRTCRVYNHDSGALLAEGSSQWDGNFAIPLDLSVDKVFLVVLDGPAEPVYNSKIVDKLQPAAVVL